VTKATAAPLRGSTFSRIHFFASDDILIKMNILIIAGRLVEFSSHQLFLTSANYVIFIENCVAKGGDPL